MQSRKKTGKFLDFLDFKGFVQAIIYLQLITYFMRMMLGERGVNLVKMLQLDSRLMLEGQVWRSFTFAFNTIDSHPLFYIILVFFMLFMTDILYNYLGNLRTNIFFVLGLLVVSIGGFFFGFISPQHNKLVSVTFSSIFLMQFIIIAAGMVAPRVEILLMFVLPLQLRWLSIVTAVGMVWIFIYQPVLRPIILLSSFSFAFYLMPRILREFYPKFTHGARKKALSSGRLKMNVINLDKKKEEEQSFHLCSSCQKTENSDPELEFRVIANGSELCLDCIKKERQKDGKE